MSTALEYLAERLHTEGLEPWQIADAVDAAACQQAVGAYKEWLADQE
jgi:hypothetical protein